MAEYLRAKKRVKSLNITDNFLKQELQELRRLHEAWGDSHEDSVYLGSFEELRDHDEESTPAENDQDEDELTSDEGTTDLRRQEFATMEPVRDDDRNRHRPTPNAQEVVAIGGLIPVTNGLQSEGELALNHQDPHGDVIDSVSEVRKHASGESAYEPEADTPLEDLNVETQHERVEQRL